MKRDKSLIPLSQDHHNGLMLAQLIKKDAPVYKGLPTDSTGKVKYAIEKWKSELIPHFNNEEKILFPFVRGRDKEIDKLIDEILREHKILNELFELLESESSVENTLNEIGILLENHIRKEERELFQLIQKVFGDKLKKLEGKIFQVKQMCKT